MKNSICEVKLILLTEFEKQLDYIINQHQKNNLNNDECLKHLHSLKRAWNINRIDIKNHGEKSNSIKFIEYENNINISFPKWNENDKGKGSVISYANKDTHFFFQCINDGQLEFKFRCIDFNNYDQKRVPVYVNYKKIIVNDETIFEGNKVSWHDNSLTYRKKCNDAEIVYLNVESDTIYTYFPELKIMMDKFTKDNLKQNYTILKSYLKSNRQTYQI